MCRCSRQRSCSSPSLHPVFGGPAGQRTPGPWWAPGLEVEAAPMQPARHAGARALLRKAARLRGCSDQLVRSELARFSATMTLTPSNLLRTTCVSVGTVPRTPSIRPESSRTRQGVRRSRFRFILTGHAAIRRRRRPVIPEVGAITSSDGRLLRGPTRLPRPSDEH